MRNKRRLGGIARGLAVWATGLAVGAGLTLAFRLRNKPDLGWAQLGWYAGENALVPGPQPGERRVVFLGDSITENWADLHPEFFTGRPYFNRGIGGQTTPQILLRFEQDAARLQPQAVLLLAGINDIAADPSARTMEAMQNNFVAMVAMARHAHVRLVLCAVLPASGFSWRPGARPREHVLALNAWLRRLAAAEDLVYIDYYAAMVKPDGGIRQELFEDGVHPNGHGYAVLEPLAEAGIERALARPAP